MSTKPDSGQQKRMDFDQLCDIFVRLNAHSPAAEMHGLLAGQLCAGRIMTRETWLRAAREFMDVEAELEGDEADALFALYEQTLLQLRGSDSAFQPLIADEISEIAVRLETLAQWCTGFLAGFALVERSVAMPELVADAIEDLAAIAQVGLEDEDEGEEDDFAQVQAYVRLVAMNIFMECSPASIALEAIEADSSIAAGEASDNLLDVGSEEKASEPSQPVGSIQNLFGRKTLH
jgi:hypothetical protein